MSIVCVCALFSCLSKWVECHMSGCQNYGPSLGTLNNRCRIIMGTQKGAIILTTTHMTSSFHVACWFFKASIMLRVLGSRSKPFTGG